MAMLYRYYSDKNTIFHRLNPISKFVWFGSVALVVTLFNTWDFTLAALIYVLIIASLARFDWRKYSYSMIFVVVMMGVCLLLWPLFIPGGRVIYQFNSPIGTWFLTDKGASTGVGIGLRMATSIVACFTLFSTTKQQEFIDGLRGLRLSTPLAFGIMLALRFAPTLAGEVGRVKEAQKARAFEMNKGSLLRRVRAYTENMESLVIPTMNRVLKSINDLTICLDSKGCDFSKEMARPKIVFTTADKIFVAICLAILGASIVLRLLGYGFIWMY